eukprot:scaffold197648_cov31-Tisochrysis_lutea.AAC.2
MEIASAQLNFLSGSHTRRRIGFLERSIPQPHYGPSSARELDVKFVPVLFAPTAGFLRRRPNSLPGAHNGPPTFHGHAKILRSESGHHLGELCNKLRWAQQYRLLPVTTVR